MRLNNKADHLSFSHSPNIINHVISGKERVEGGRGGMVDKVIRQEVREAIVVPWFRD